MLAPERANPLPPAATVVVPADPQGRRGVYRSGEREVESDAGAPVGVGRRPGVTAMRRATACTIASPRPAPDEEGAFWAPRTNGSKAFTASSGGKPSPSSRTSMVTPDGPVGTPGRSEGEPA